jgi:hypothetical protein
MATRRQKGNLPKTYSSMIADESITYLGLPGFWFMLPLLIFMVVNFVTNQFPIGLLFAVISWVLLRTYIKGKPNGFVTHFFLYVFYWKKKLSHRTRDKKPIFQEEIEGIDSQEEVS